MYPNMSMFAMEGLNSLAIGSLQGREEHILYSTVTFRCLLDSLARPGKPNRLAYPTSLEIPPDLYLSSTSKSVSLNFYALGALGTLLDGETSFIIAAHGQWFDQDDPAVRWLTLRSGSTVVPANVADFAFFCEGSSQGLLRELNPGSLLEPELSATAMYCVEYLEEMEYKKGSGHPREAFQQYAESELNHSSNDAITLELRGPGIRECRYIKVVGLDQGEVELIKATRRNFPLGIDIYLVDSAGRCVGLPRTTKLYVRDRYITSEEER
jgi:alpha-D-ribose 1-methylphosphonate 5-triphosphate synthase subunit PhnH